jgi:hypothetical protein
MEIGNDDIPRPAYATEDLDEVARQGRCAMIWWYSQATILLPMQFQYPERVHEKAGRELTAHVDAEARRAKEERVAARGRTISESLRRTIMEMGRIAAEGRRLRFRRFAHGRLSTTD